MINVQLGFNKVFFIPGEELEIKGSAIKANGVAVDGFATAIIEIPGAMINNTIQNQTNQTQQNQTIINNTGNNNSNIVLSFSVLKGDYNYKFKFAKDIAPGAKKISIKIEDSYGNQGAASGIIDMAAVPTKLVLETAGGSKENNNLFYPDTVISIKAILLDQASQIMDGNLSLKIQKGKVLLQQLLKSNETTIYRFEKTAAPGDYEIKIYGEGLETRKTIYMAELKEINITLENDTLHVVNVGNVAYKEPLQVTFTSGDKTETKVVDLNLDIGQEVFIKLEAPAGDYNVDVAGTGIHQTLKFEGVPLTGDVIATLKLGKEQGNFKDIFIFILVALIIVVGAIFFVHERKKRKYGWGRGKSEEKERKKEEQKEKRKRRKRRKERNGRKNRKILEKSRGRREN